MLSIEDIKKKLGANYSKGDDSVINNDIEHYTAIASDSSNRNINDPKLHPYVYTAVIMSYNRRGKEGSSNSSEGSISDTFIDIEEKLRKDIRSIRRLA